MGDSTVSNGAMDPQKFRSTMTALNHGSVMQAAARNLQKEMLRDAEATARNTEGASRAVIDMQDLEQVRARPALREHVLGWRLAIGGGLLVALTSGTRAHARGADGAPARRNRTRSWSRFTATASRR
jgi:hypothetical protein